MSTETKTLRSHWDTMYRTRGPEERSWTQRRPTRSLLLIRAARLRRGAVILDAGAGASKLVDFLAKSGDHQLVLVDLSGAALREAKKRLGRWAANVRFVRADLAKDRLDFKVDLWHDRAVFHFLTRAVDRKRYMSNLKRCLLPGGRVIISTFSPTGPERCSGLPVRRYSAAALARELGPGYKVMRRMTEKHRKPFGGLQDFVYVMATKSRS